MIRYVWVENAMVHLRTAVVSPAITTYWKRSAIRTTINMRNYWNGWATILIQTPFPSMTSTEASPLYGAAGRRMQERKTYPSYAGLPKGHDVRRNYASSDRSVSKVISGGQPTLGTARAGWNALAKAETLAISPTRNRH